MVKVHPVLARRIKRYYDAGYTIGELMDHFELDYQTVCRIVGSTEQVGGRNGTNTH